MEINDSTRTVLVFVAALAILEIGREMRESGPSLKEMRQTEDGDRHVVLQHLIDAHAETGILVGGVALVAWWASRDIVPALVIVGVFGALVWYQHSVLRAPAIY